MKVATEASLDTFIETYNVLRDIGRMARAAILLVGEEIG